MPFFFVVRGQKKCRSFIFSYCFMEGMYSTACRWLCRFGVVSSCICLVAVWIRSKRVVKRDVCCCVFLACRRSRKSQLAKPRWWMWCVVCGGGKLNFRLDESLPAKRESVEKRSSSCVYNSYDLYL